MVSDAFAASALRAAPEALSDAESAEDDASEAKFFAAFSDAFAADALVAEASLIAVNAVPSNTLVAPFALFQAMTLSPSSRASFWGSSLIFTTVIFV